MKTKNKGNCPWAGRLRPFFILGLSLIFLYAAAGRLFADDAKNKIFAERAHDAFRQAQTQYQAQTTNPVLAWQFARTCFDWADWATNKTDRADIAQQGIAACRQALLFTNAAAAHYYLALNMGQLAQAETLSALKLVREMARELTTANELEPHLDFAGPNRSLGLLYRDAPGWPVSIGSRRKAQDFLETAGSLAPHYPENILNLAESYANWGDALNARKQLAALDALWPKAQTNLTGAAWEQSWDDWSKRRDELRKELNQH
jgi:hypothetical protein